MTTICRPFRPWPVRETEMFVINENQGPLARARRFAAARRRRGFSDAVAQTPESRFVEVDGARIHYLRWGDRAQPGLLLVHGNAAHAHWWDFIAPMLARDYNVAAIDLSGMGDSDWRRDGYSMERFAREEIAVCEDAGMFVPTLPPMIVGHSFGGFVTILTGALYGERLAGTVIVDSPVNPPERQGTGPAQRVVKPHHIYPTLAAALARFRLMPPQTSENLYLVDWVGRHSLKEVRRGSRLHLEVRSRDLAAFLHRRHRRAPARDQMPDRHIPGRAFRAPAAPTSANTCSTCSAARRRWSKSRRPSITSCSTSPWRWWRRCGRCSRTGTIRSPMRRV